MQRIGEKERERGKKRGGERGGGGGWGRNQQQKYQDVYLATMKSPLSPHQKCSRDDIEKLSNHNSGKEGLYLV